MTSKKQNVAWTNEEIDMAKALWAQGLTVRSIGRILGRTERGVYAQIELNRAEFPRRRANRDDRTYKTVNLTVTMPTYRVLRDRAVAHGGSIAMTMRDCIEIAAYYNFELPHEVKARRKAYDDSVAVKAHTRRFINNEGKTRYQVQKERKLIPFAGAE